MSDEDCLWRGQAGEVDIKALAQNFGWTRSQMVEAIAWIGAQGFAQVVPRKTRAETERDTLRRASVSRADELARPRLARAVWLFGL